MTYKTCKSYKTYYLFVEQPETEVIHWYHHINFQISSAFWIQIQNIQIKGQLCQQ